MYLSLTPDPATPERVKDFIAKHVDMQFHDVHCMLRLPMPERALRAGCNFAAASTLLGLVSGASVMLFAPDRFHDKKDRGKLFQDVLRCAYPWLKGRSAVDPVEANETLWELYRTPFAHSLGVPHPRGQWGKVLKPAGMSEQEVMALEVPGPHPKRLPPMLVKTGSTYKLNVHTLYWGTRWMFEKLTEDAARMKRAENLLEGLEKEAGGVRYTKASTTGSAIFPPGSPFRKSVRSPTTPH